MTAFLGVDVGATSTKAVVGAADWTVTARAERETPHGPDGAAVTEAALETIRTAAAEAGHEPTDLTAVAVGSLGPLDRRAGTVEAPPNLPADRVALVDPIDDLVDADVLFHNDAVAGAIGERFYGPADPTNLVYPPVSTGLGAGAIVDGHPLAGREGNAAEAGHFTLDPDGPALCGCGGAGHWEGYSAGSNLPRYAAHVAEATGLETDLDLPACEPQAVLDAAAADPADPLAAEVLERVGRWNALGVATLVHAYDPEVVAVGGGVAVNNPAVVLDPVREQLPDLILREPPDLRLATQGADAVVTGALASAITGGTGRA